MASPSQANVQMLASHRTGSLPRLFLSQISAGSFQSRDASPVGTPERCRAGGPSVEPPGRAQQICHLFSLDFLRPLSEEQEQRRLTNQPVHTDVHGSPLGEGGAFPKGLVCVAALCVSPVPVLRPVLLQGRGRFKTLLTAGNASVKVLNEISQVRLFQKLHFCNGLTRRNRKMQLGAPTRTSTVVEPQHPLESKASFSRGCRALGRNAEAQLSVSAGFTGCKVFP